MAMRISIPANNASELFYEIADIMDQIWNGKEKRHTQRKREIIPEKEDRETLFNAGEYRLLFNYGSRLFKTQLNLETVHAHINIFLSVSIPRQSAGYWQPLDIDTLRDKYSHFAELIEWSLEEIYTLLEQKSIAFTSVRGFRIQIAV